MWVKSKIKSDRGIFKPKKRNLYTSYRLYRFLINKRKKAISHLIYLKYRFTKRISYRYRETAKQFIKIRYRLIKFLQFRSIKRLVYIFFRLWIRKIHNIENLEFDEPCIIVSNHCSYFDFWTLESILKNRAVFLSATILKERKFIVRWLLKLPRIIFINRDKPEMSSVRKALNVLKKDKMPLVMYPEGTRSRTGRMQKPKLGFIKFALMARVPILPIAMKGTYEILPPHGRFPKFKKCEIIIGEKFYPQYLRKNNNREILHRTSEQIMSKIQNMLKEE